MTPTTWPAHYLDGQTAVRHPATARLMREGLEVSTPGGATQVWPYHQIRRTQGAYEGEAVRLERGAGPGEALIVDDPGFLASLSEVSPRLGRAFRHPGHRGRRRAGTALAGLAAAGFLAGLYLWGIPGLAGLVATRMPAHWEQKLGRRAVDGLVPPEARCAEGPGVTALDGIVRRLTAALPPLPYPPELVVVDQPVENAFAAPGGFIVLSRGLVARAGSPEEVAGVLAHELQHVARRHATRHMIERASVGFLLTALLGDVTGPMTYGAEAARLLGELSYSRSAEEEADREGLRLLVAARIDPAGLIAVLERMLADEAKTPGLLTYLSTHPSAPDRIRRLRALAAATPVQAEPLLTPAAWAAVKRVCEKPRLSP
jgi:Zn-dependent protease with chaperone function